MTLADHQHNPFSGYQSRLREISRVASVDEVFAGGQVRAGQELIANAAGSLGLGGLLAARAEARRLVEDEGVRYGTDSARGRSWEIDPIPVLIGSREWAGLEAGVVQRAQLQQLILTDLYGARQLIRDRVLPAEIIFGHPGFIRAVDQIAPRLVLNATDLGRGADGNWTAIASKTAAPSGAGYAMVNRRITSRVMAGLHRNTNLERLRGFFDTMAAALSASAEPEAPRVAVLSAGAGSETAYDQAFLATLLGFPLVEADDLSVRDGKVWIRATRGREQVDVLVRRVDAEYCDPLELRGDSQLGLPGLVEASRTGAVTLTNPMGAGVLENAGLAAYLPTLARHLLGEELRLPAAQTWWCGAQSERDHVLTRMSELVIKPIENRPDLTYFGWELSEAERTDLAARIAAQPWAWVGQQQVPLSTAPLVTPEGLAPGRLVLRAFTVAHNGVQQVLPGGLGRVNTDPDSTLVSSMSGAVAKDVWVLSDADTPARGRGAYVLAARPQRATVVAPRVADNLFWLGRYSERAESTARLLRVVDDLAEDNARRADTPGGVTTEVMLQAAAAITGVPPEPDQPVVDHLREMVVGAQPGTVAHAAGRLAAAAQSVRDQVSRDIWHILSRLTRNLAEIAPDEAQLQPQLDRILASLLGVSGVVAESMVRDQTWGFLDAGIRIERAQATVSLLRSTLAQERPPIIDGQVTEAVLESGESLITHRRRTASGEGPTWPVHSAVSLLLLDSGNPRSVAFQVQRLDQAMQLIGDTELAAAAADLTEMIGALDLEASCAGERVGLATALGEFAARLRDFSDELTRVHFTRKPTQRVIVSDWARR